MLFKRKARDRMRIRQGLEYKDGSKDICISYGGSSVINGYGETISKTYQTMYYKWDMSWRRWVIYTWSTVKVGGLLVKQTKN